MRMILTCGTACRVTGIEMSQGVPSKMTMLRLAANSEFRAAAENLVKELKNAGVDLSSPVGIHICCILK